MSEPWTLRPAVRDDAPAISRLIRELTKFSLADPDDPESAAPFFDSITPQAIEGYLDGNYVYHVVEHGDDLAGVVAIRDHSHLYHLFVAERFHRQGLGARLWSHARQVAMDAGNEGLFTVNASVYAVPVYERFGFVAQGPVIHKDGLAFVSMELDERTVREAAGDP